MLIIYVLLAVFVGVGFATQTVVNSKIAISLSSPINAVLLSFLVSVFAILGFKVFSGNMIIAGIRSISPWWYVSGGVLGALSLTILIFITPKLGVSLAISIMIAAQLVMALLFDHFGMFGLEERPVNLYKIMGVLCLLTGAFLCLYYR